MKLNIDNSEVVQFTNRLEKMHKSDLPIAIRSTLNSAAFDVKKVTMPKSANDQLTVRRINFFKSKSNVSQATGFAVNKMESALGFSGKDQAVRNLEQIEHGGTIEGRSFIPFESARVGNKTAGVMKRNSTLNNFKNAIDARKMNVKTDGQKFAMGVKKAGVDGAFIADYKDKTILWRVNSLNKTKKGSWKLTGLFSYSKDRSVEVDGTDFLKKAGDESAKKLDQLFKIQAEKRLNKK